MPASASVRTERDALGPLSLPADALWGIHTARSLANLRFSRRTLGEAPAYLGALARVKRAAARANLRAGVLEPRIAEAIERAALALEDGAHAEHFPVDLLGGGGSIGVHMNLNEVLANLANESLGARRGDYAPVRVLEHVSASQSTADVCHTASRLAVRALAHAAGRCARCRGRGARRKGRGARADPGARAHLPARRDARLGGRARARLGNACWSARVSRSSTRSSRSTRSRSVAP